MSEFFSVRESAILEYAKTQRDPNQALRIRMAESNVKISKEKIAVALNTPRDQWDAAYLRHLSKGGKHAPA